MEKTITRESREQVSKMILKAWDKKYELGHIEKIKQATGLSVVTISNALKGVATPSTVQAINNYYGIN